MQLTIEQATAIINQVLNQCFAGGTVKTMQDAAAIIQAWNLVNEKLRNEAKPQ